MNESRSKSYKPFYESQYYKQIKETDRSQDENLAQIKADKMKQFYEHIKEHFVPEVDAKKR